MHQTSPGDVLKCSIKRIRAEEVEDVINAHVSVMLKDGNYLKEIAGRITSQGKDQQISSDASKSRLKKDIKECEMEMEAAFKLQMAYSGGNESLKFILDKLEFLGKRKAALG